jgi:hypothetical protein
MFNCFCCECGSVAERMVILVRESHAVPEWILLVAASSRGERSPDKGRLPRYF